MARAQTSLLHQLARLYGIQTAYYDVAHRRQQASPEGLLLALKALDAPVEGLGDVPAALEERRRALGEGRVEPVLVAWEGAPLQIDVPSPASQERGGVVCHLALEGGDTRTWVFPLDSLPVVGQGAGGYLRRRLTFPSPVPLGYHRLRLESGGKEWDSTIISAPVQAYDNGPRGQWGVFLPLYALRTGRDWGAGDLSDLEALAEWTRRLGGGVVATLPLLAAFLGEPYEPSPYSPASRLFWNEFYLGLEGVPEFHRCPQVRELASSEVVAREVRELRATRVVDYRRLMALKRRVLEAMARCLFSEGGPRLEELRRFLREHPQVEDYARFRAVGERLATPWTQWPQRLREGRIGQGDYDEEAVRLHLYAQWLAQQQLERLAGKAREAGHGLYLDLPLGVHPESYDVWRERGAFVQGVSAGAPPDSFFTKGQDWGFPPLHPEGLRRQGYRYFIAYLRHHLRHAGLLRIDHVMGFHRLFWVPQGLKPAQGVYVHYQPEEFYAILSLESHRHRAVVVGEDLGTVPGYVREAMGQHNVQRMYVVQYEVAPGSPRVLRPVPPSSIASLNTHDMPTFAAFWQALDIQDREALDLLDRAGVVREKKAREAVKRALADYLRGLGWLKGSEGDTQAMLRACLYFLAASRARLVLVNLEDLWLETEPQNTPGTLTERVNWRRKARYTLEEFSKMPQVVEVLREINSIRRRVKS